MEKKLILAEYGKQLWTRDKARPIRVIVEELLENSDPGDTVVIDTADVEVFDYSFANELFGKIIVSLPSVYPGRFFIVENLAGYTRENLSKALESLNLAMIERKDNQLVLIGKTHPADASTFTAIVEAKEPISSSLLKDKLDINLTTVNERLVKLMKFGLVRREKTVSTVNREQYQYSVLR